MITDIKSEYRLSQQIFGDHLRGAFGWNSIYTDNAETIGRQIMLWRAAERIVVQALVFLYVICVMNREIQL
jgi:hypothetical protein